MQLYLLAIALVWGLAAAVTGLTLREIPKPKIHANGASLWHPRGNSTTREDHLRFHGRSKEDHDYITAAVQRLRNASSMLRHGKEFVANDINDTQSKAARGDILLTRGQVEKMERHMASMLLKANKTKSSGRGRKARQVEELLPDLSNIWTSFPIPYTIDPLFNAVESDAIRAAIQLWTSLTCVTFQEFAPDATVEGQYLLFTDANDGCNGFIGQIDTNDVTPPQPINLQRNGCLNFLGTIAHEIGHSLGLYHEMDRPDRASTLTVLWENIQPGATLQFETNDTVLTYGLPYDLGSVMQYAAQSFATIAGLTTMIPLNPEYVSTMGQSTEIGFYDAQLINKLYCNAACTTTLSCQNGGYTDPNDCTSCRCPDGFGGTLCETVASGSPGCSPQSGAITVDTSASLASPHCLQTPNYTYPNIYGHGSYQEGDSCAWTLKAPVGCTLDLWFNSAWFGLIDSTEGSCQHWVEVKYKSSHSVRGERICGFAPKYNSTSHLVSQTNDVTVIFKSPPHGPVLPFPWYYLQGFKLCYAISNPSCGASK